MQRIPNKEPIAIETEGRDRLAVDVRSYSRGKKGKKAYIDVLIYFDVAFGVDSVMAGLLEETSPLKELLPERDF